MSYYGSCFRKIRYRTKKRAENMVRQIRKTHIVQNPIRIYQCDCCMGWHITSMSEGAYAGNNH